MLAQRERAGADEQRGEADSGAAAAAVQGLHVLGGCVHPEVGRDVEMRNLLLARLRPGSRMRYLPEARSVPYPTALLRRSKRFPL